MDFVCECLSNILFHEPSCPSRSTTTSPPSFVFSFGLLKIPRYLLLFSPGEPLLITCRFLTTYSPEPAAVLYPRAAIRQCSRGRNFDLGRSLRVDFESLTLNVESPQLSRSPPCSIESHAHQPTTTRTPAYTSNGALQAHGQLQAHCVAHLPPLCWSAALPPELLQFFRPRYDASGDGGIH